MKDPQQVFEVNVEVTQRLLEGARNLDVASFVFASSNAVVGETGGAIIDETTTMRPLTPYGATKAAAEMLCSAYTESYGLRACAVRFTNVYGHGMGGKDTFVVRLMRAAAAARDRSASTAMGCRNATTSTSTTPRQHCSARPTTVSPDL